ncbi:hypothetical protein CTEN210_00998 [Chaetoceros tenuissimus]|uniref:Kinesin light chain n=1 Tax=Chaetoceros tenuissimus TaxID=426638 RepID=A0AAD3GZN8_9STRA|nr:hypothetical protein CTEN210_00998 [Chaetoceros tenuissimus]
MKMIDILVQQNNLAVSCSSCDHGGYDAIVDQASDPNRERGTFTRRIRIEKGEASSFSSFSSAGIEARLSDAIHSAQKMSCDVLYSSASCSILPVVDFSSRCFFVHTSSCDHDTSMNRSKTTNQSSGKTFEEGTSAFTHNIALSIVQESYQETQRIAQGKNYAVKTVTATLLFNMGVCKARDDDYISAKSYFQQALELLYEVKLDASGSVTSNSSVITTTASSNVSSAKSMRQQVLATHMLLTSITLLNLGHVEWHLSNPDDSIRSYHLCLKSLQYIESSELHSEALFYGRNVTAACLNCIGMVFLHQRVVPCQGDENDSQKLETQANLCLKYLEASLTIYEDCKSDNTIPEHYMMTFKANIATVLNNLGRVYYIINDFSQALYCQGACLRERSICLPSTHLDLGVAHFNVAQSLVALDEKEEAMEHYHSFLSVARPILGCDDTIIAKAVITIADLYIDMEDFLGAEMLLREHLSSLAFVSTTSSYDESKVTLLNTLSAVLGYQYKFEDALEALYQARDILMLPQDDDSTVRSYITNCCNIAVVLSKEHKIEKAVIMFQKALAKIKSLENQKPFSNLLIEIHMNIADIYESIGNLSICAYHLEQVVAISKQFHGPMNPHVSTSLNQLGLMYFKEQKYETALSTFLECLHMRTTSKKSTKSQIVAVLYNVATVYKAMGMTEEALQIYLKVLTYERQSMKEKEKSNNPKDLIHTLRHIFQLYADNDDQSLSQKEGLHFLEEAVDICRHYKDKIDDSLGRSIFFMLGEHLTLNQEVHEGFAYYCEGCQLFGDVDDDTVYAAGENGLRIILAQLCTDERVFPIHAAAA